MQNDNVKFKIFFQTGFSIMEMIIAMGIFALLILATFGIFSSSLRGQQNALAQTKIEREAQLILETIAKKIRSSRVDYTAYGASIPAEAAELILIDQADSQVRFQFNQSNSDIDLKIDNNPSSPITSSDVSVTSLKFFILPSTNPFGGGSPPAAQPRVTVVMTLESQIAGEQIQVTVQQTIPQRGGGF